MALSPKQARFCKEYVIDLNGAQAAIRAGIEVTTIGVGYYVYMLVNSITNRIIYIGKGKNNRLNAHHIEFRSGKIINTAKHKEFSNAYADGGEIKPFIIFNNLSEYSALEIERYLISNLKSHGLSNIAGGIENNEDRERVFAIRMLSRMMPFERWFNERLPAQFEQEIYHRMRVELTKMANA